MSNSRGNMEILDVLSSIRRLVSEDRRVEVTERAEPVLTSPAPTASADDAPAPAAQDGAIETAQAPAGDEAPVPAAGKPAVWRPGESRFVLTAALRVGDEGDAAASGAGSTDAGDEAAGRDRLSLESTIAELEAAVAGIEAEFEPDGGDEAAHAELAAAGPMPAWPVTDRSAAAPVPDVPKPDPAVVPEPVSEVSAPSAPPPAAATVAPAAQVGGFHGIMAGFETMPSADERLDLPITGDVTVPSPRRGEDWTSTAAMAGAGAFFRAASRVPGGVPLEFPSDVGHLAGAGASEGEADGPMEPEPEASGDADADGAYVRSTARPVILRTRTADAATEPDTDAGSLDGADAEDGDLTAVGQDPDGGDEPDLFDPLAGTDIDIDMLRDMVAEIVRDELRGTLGERITRNLRTLVRREIDRALIAEGLKRD